jgi:hypothetical protein
MLVLLAQYGLQGLREARVLVVLARLGLQVILVQLVLRVPQVVQVPQVLLVLTVLQVLLALQVDLQVRQVQQELQEALLRVQSRSLPHQYSMPQDTLVSR